MSRYDYLYIHHKHFKTSGITESDILDLTGLEFQTKDIDREYLTFTVDENGDLFFDDYHYELVDSDGGLFMKQLQVVYDGRKPSKFTGVVMFYGKPYESMYTFQCKIVNGKLKYIRLLSII
jgi:hypothetical protein